MNGSAIKLSQNITIDGITCSVSFEVLPDIWLAQSGALTDGYTASDVQLSVLEAGADMHQSLLACVDTFRTGLFAAYVKSNEVVVKNQS